MFEHKPAIVYCKNCRWNYSVTACKKGTTVKQTPLAPEVRYARCFEKNKHNDCPEFEEKTFASSVLNFFSL